MSLASMSRNRLHRVAREVGSATRITLGPSSLRSADVLAVQAELARAERGTVNTGVLHAGRSTGSNMRDLAQVTAVERAKHFQIVANLMRTLGLSKLPTIAVLDGQATGIALGIGAHAAACVVTERTRLSLPGPAFGFVPESFASYQLARLPGGLGAYLSLTGASLSGPELVELGLATHATESQAVHRIEAEQADYARATALLRQGRSRADCERAASLLEGLLAKGEDGDGRLSLACAKALNAIMRIRTNSNTLHITRLLDTPENKVVWRSLGPRALELATRAKKARPQDPEALVAYADAYFFANSVKGVLAAAVTGSGLEFKGNSKELIRRCPRADGGVGHCYLGAFFLMAPWPLCNPKRAEEHLSTAHRIVPSRRNSYYMGVLHYRLGRPAEAERYFRQALSAKCASASEADFGGFMLRESKAALDACARPKAH